ncbi:MAG: alternative ribosome rescue aminoacyl-tRNA hydrolase ArfB [Thermoanaerobaculia bacterium]
MTAPSIEVNDGLSIPAGEVRYIASRSGGPGGQNVNKVNSKVTLLFDIGASAALTDDQKNRIRARLATRVSGDDVLQVSSQRFRTQLANREAATLRFAELIAAALREKKRRKATRVPRAAVQKRLESKRARSLQKMERKVPTE